MSAITAAPRCVRNGKSNLRARRNGVDHSNKRFDEPTLALIETQLASAQASAVWIAYSELWQFWNVIHICTAAVAGLLTLTQPGRDSVNA